MSNNQLEIGAGSLLLSDPFLPDPNFSRTVVLLTEHLEQGTVGFILNRITDHFVSDVVEDFPIFKSPVHIGGPVDLNSLQYIHTLGEDLPGSVQVMDNLYWGGDFEVLKIRVESGLVKPEQIKFFAGYSGWGMKQLEEEIEQDSWLLFEASLDYVMSEDEELWKHFLQDMGGEFRQMSHYPMDPRLN